MFLDQLQAFCSQLGKLSVMVYVSALISQFLVLSQKLKVIQINLTNALQKLSQPFLDFFWRLIGGQFLKDRLDLVSGVLILALGIKRLNNLVFVLGQLLLLNSDQVFVDSVLLFQFVNLLL
jgi:hypothetical protein